MPSGRYWLKEEEEIFKSLWGNPNISSDQIMIIMQRPWAGLKAKATQLGLETRDMLEARWRLEEIKKRMQEVLEA